MKIMYIPLKKKRVTKPDLKKKKNNELPNLTWKNNNNKKTSNRTRHGKKMQLDSLIGRSGSSKF